MNPIQMYVISKAYGYWYMAEPYGKVFVHQWSVSIRYKDGTWEDFHQLNEGTVASLRKMGNPISFCPDWYTPKEELVGSS